MEEAAPAAAPAAPLPTEAVPAGALLSRRFVVLTLATLSYFTALGALLPTLPRYVKHELGGGGLEVGIAVGAFAVSAALLRPLVGRLGDTYGRRILVIGGSAIMGVSILGYTLVSNLPVLILLRLLSGTGEAAMWVGAATAVQDMAPDDRRGEAASYYSVALYGGLALGPAVGEHLSHSSFNAVWIFAACCCFVATLLGTTTPTGPRSGRRQQRFLHPAAVGPGLILCLGLLPFIGFSAFFPIYGDKIGLHNTGTVFVFYATFVLLIRLLGARLPDRLGFRRASTAALLAVATAGAILGGWADSTGVWIAAGALAIGMSLLFPALFSATVGEAPEEERSHAVGTFSLFFDVASGLGAPALGVVVSLTSERGAFIASAIVAAIGLTFIRRAVRNEA